MTPCSFPATPPRGWTAGPATPGGPMWMCASDFVPGRLFATIRYETVPVASSVTWKTARPRAEFDMPAHAPVSSSVLSTATNVEGAGWSARAVAPMPANARSAPLNAMAIVRMTIPPYVAMVPSPYGASSLADQIALLVLTQVADPHWAMRELDRPPYRATERREQPPH